MTEPSLSAIPDTRATGQRPTGGPAADMDETTDEVSVLWALLSILLTGGAVLPVNGTTGAVLNHQANINTVKAFLGSTVPAAMVANVQYMDRLGADPTGSTDCTSIFNTALSNLPTTTLGGNPYPYGTIVFGNGQYKLAGSPDTSTIGPLVHVVGQGERATTIFYYGSGRAFRFQNPNDGFGGAAFNPANQVLGGGLSHMTIDGDNATGSAIGLQYGDLAGMNFDPVTVQNFDEAGQVGIQGINEVWCTEKIRMYARLINNTVGLQFTVTDGPSVANVTLASATGGVAQFTVVSGGFPGFFGGTSANGTTPQVKGSGGITTPGSGTTSTLNITNVSGNTLTCSYTGTAPSASGTGTLTMCSSTNSFDYSDYILSVFTTLGVVTAGVAAGQEPVQVLNGANPSDGRFWVRANCNQGPMSGWSGGTAPGIVHIDGAMPLGHPDQGASYISDMNLMLHAEGDGSTGTYSGVVPFYFTGAASSTPRTVSACEGIIFLVNTAASIIGTAGFTFSGVCRGDPTLSRAGLLGGGGGSGTGPGSTVDTGRAIDTNGRPYQQITGLTGTTPFTLVGAVSGAHPTSGTFAVNDVVLDLTAGGTWVCTVAGTPGTWVNFP